MIFRLSGILADFRPLDSRATALAILPKSDRVLITMALPVTWRMTSRNVSMSTKVMDSCSSYLPSPMGVFARPAKFSLFDMTKTTGSKAIADSGGDARDGASGIFFVRPPPCNLSGTFGLLVGL